MLASFDGARAHGGGRDAHDVRPLALATALLLVIAGCGDRRDVPRATPASDTAPATVAGASAPLAIEVTDDAGRTVRLAAPARRVISLVPAQTETLLELGLANRLIARTAFDRQPALAALPSTGNALTPNLEWIAAQRPDLVISWADAQSRSIVARLDELGIATYASALETTADIERSIQRLGALTGREAAADSLRRALRAQLEAVAAEVAGRTRPRVFYVIGTDPTMAAGPGTFVHEALVTAGGENIFADASARWPLVSMEEVVRRDPEVIVLAVEQSRAEGEALIARLRTLPGWRELTAVRTGRVHWADPDLFSRPAPSIARATRMLAHMLHPELR